MKLGKLGQSEWQMGLRIFRDVAVVVVVDGVGDGDEYCLQNMGEWETVAH